jgi:hypothetical protein
VGMRLILTGWLTAAGNSEILTGDVRKGGS